MNIGVDIDEVVAEFVEALNVYLKNKHNMHYTKDQYKTYWFNDLWKLPHDQFLEMYRPWRQSAEFDAMLPVKDSQQILNDLAKRHNIFFITSREPDIAERTEQWLNKHFDFPIKVFYGRHPLSNKAGKTKIDICKDLHINVILEDQDKLTMECADGGIPVVLFDQPWNQHVIHPLVTRVKDWQEAKEVLEKMRQSIAE